MERWWINGEPGRAIDVTDRGLTYGDGLFETIAIRDGQPRFLAHHLDRLPGGLRPAAHCRAPDRARLAADLAAAAAGLRHGVLKLVAHPRAGAQRLRAARCSLPRRWPGARRETEPRASGPIQIRWCETMVSANPATAGLKTLGRLEQVLARAEWSQPEVSEGLMTSTEGRLIGGTASNVFLVAGDRLLTPVAGPGRHRRRHAARGAGGGAQCGHCGVRSGPAAVRSRGRSGGLPDQRADRNSSRAPARVRTPGPRGRSPASCRRGWSRPG